jgi:predicted nucleic-acid-binding protein
VVAEASASGEPLLITLCALLETEWVLRSRYKVDRASMTAAVIAMLETPGIEFEHAPTVEEALYLFEQHPSADFADCLLVARSTHLGRDRFLTFDAGVAKLPRTELVQ